MSIATAKPTNRPITPRRIEDDADQLIHKVFGQVEDALGYDCPLELQRARVERLREDLAAAEALLERMLAPVRKLEALVTGEEFKRLEDIREYDEALRELLGKYQLKRTDYGSKGKATGAVKWADLKKRGATDAQIEKNLRTIPRHAITDRQIALQGGDTGFLRRGLDGRGWEPLIKGKADLIKEVRRVMEIGLPEKPATNGQPNGKPAAKKKAATKAPKRKATKKKKGAEPAAVNGSATNGEAEQPKPTEKTK